MRKRAPKIQPNRLEMLNEFWGCLEDGLFGQRHIAAIRDISESTLENERWLGTGPQFRKIDGRILYKKKDVLDFINSFPLQTKNGE